LIWRPNGVGTILLSLSLRTDLVCLRYLFLWPFPIFQRTFWSILFPSLLRDPAESVIRYRTSVCVKRAAKVQLVSISPNFFEKIFQKPVFEKNLFFETGCKDMLT